MEEPIYGDLNPSFTNFMAPGIILRWVRVKNDKCFSLAFIFVHFCAKWNNLQTLMDLNPWYRSV